MRILHDLQPAFPGLPGSKRIYGIHIPIHMDAAGDQQRHYRCHRRIKQLSYGKSLTKAAKALRSAAEQPHHREKLDGAARCFAPHRCCGTGITLYVDSAIHNESIHIRQLLPFLRQGLPAHISTTASAFIPKLLIQVIQAVYIGGGLCIVSIRAQMGNGNGGQGPAALLQRQDIRQNCLGR